MEGQFEDGFEANDPAWIPVVSAERMRSVTLTAGRSRQRALQPMPHPEFVLCGWC